MLLFNHNNNDKKVIFCFLLKLEIWASLHKYLMDWSTFSYVRCHNWINNEWKVKEEGMNENFSLWNLIKNWYNISWLYLLFLVIFLFHLYLISYILGNRNWLIGLIWIEFLKLFVRFLTFFIIFWKRRCSLFHFFIFSFLFFYLFSKFFSTSLSFF